MLIDRSYINFLENLPCNRKFRKRSPSLGKWMDGWVPERTGADYVEPLQQDFLNTDAKDGVMAKLEKWELGR